MLIPPLLTFLTNISVYLSSSGNEWIIEFDTTQYNYSSYILEIKNTTDQTLDSCENYSHVVWSGRINDKKPVSVAEVPHFGTHGILCIEITPEKAQEGGNCSTRYNTFTKKIPFPLETVNEKDDKCRTLDRTFELDFDIQMGKVTAVFQTTPCMCFLEMHDPFFIFYRIPHNSSAKDCSDPHGNGLLHVNYSYRSEQTDCGFSAVLTAEPGYYCSVLEIRHKGKWCAYSSHASRLFGLLKVENFLQVVPQPTLVPYYCLGACLIAVPLILLLICIVKLKSSSGRFSAIPQSEEFELEDLMSIADSTARNMEIILFYCRDFYEHQQAVIALHIFFLEAWNIGRVQIDVKSDSEISVLGFSWVDKKLVPKPNRHIIIVESEGGVLQETKREKSKVLHRVDEDFLDAMFPYLIQTLKNNGRSHSDYSNISVVKFEYTPEDLLLTSIVPNRRFILPKHMFHLYRSVLNLPNVPLDLSKRFEEELTKKWRDILNRTLIPCINSAVTNLKTNPTLIQEGFTESVT